MGDTLSTGEAARMLGVDVSTLRLWIRRGEVRAYQTPGGHWRVPAAEVRRIRANGEGGSTGDCGRAVLYVRVRDADQQTLADRALVHLTQFALKRGYQIVDVIREVGSAVVLDGHKRNELERLRGYIREGKCEAVVVERSDRLLLTGFDEFALWAREHNVVIEEAGLGCDEAWKVYAQEIEEDLFFPLADALALVASNRARAEQAASKVVAEVGRFLGLE